jgi:hypothetical protein
MRSFVFVIRRSSFPLRVPLRIFPPTWRRKQALLVAILAVSGCGGDGDPSSQTVAGAGYRFEAPGDWVVERSGRTVSVSADNDNAAVSVTSFRLARPFRPELWRPVVRELDGVAEKLASQLGAAISDRATVEIAGRRARRYDLSGSRDRTQRIAFVLQGRWEYQLLCRSDSRQEPACQQLFASFRLT